MPAISSVQSNWFLEQEPRWVYSVKMHVQYVHGVYSYIRTYFTPPTTTLDMLLYAHTSPPITTKKPFRHASNAIPVELKFRQVRYCPMVGIKYASKHSNKITRKREKGIPNTQYWYYPHDVVERVSIEKQKCCGLGSCR